MRRKLLSRRGFTLAELMMTVLILVMVTAVVASGVPLAANAYSRVVDTANAQVLLSTAMTALRGALSTARNVSMGNADEAGKCLSVSYYSPDTGYTTLSCGYDAGAGKSLIMLEPYQNFDPASQEYTPAGAGYTRPLVSAKAITDTLQIRFTDIRYENGLFTISGLQVLRGDTVLAEAPAEGAEQGIFYIRVVYTAE